MRTIILIITLFISTSVLAQDTLVFTSWIENDKVSESTTTFVVEYLNSDDYIIDIYSKCDTVNLASSNFISRDGVRTFVLDENDDKIASIILFNNKAFVFYEDKNHKKVTEFLVD